MSNSPWWVQHRRKHFKPRNRLSTEMIFRKSFMECMGEYVVQCSIPGVRNMFDNTINFKTRAVHIIVLMGTFGTMCFFLYNMWSETLTKPLVVTTVSTTYHISNIDFPAISFCNVNRISMKAAMEYAREIYPNYASKNVTLRDVETLVLETGRLLDFSYNGSLQSNKLLDIVFSEHRDTYALVNLMERLAPKCNEMLSKCAWHGKLVNCTSIFEIRRTIRGHCCSFNYVLNYNSGYSPNGTIAPAKRAEMAGAFHGLNIILDPMIEDYAYPIYSMYGFEVLIYDPSHFPDPTGGQLFNRFVEPNQSAYMKIISTKQVASREVRKYPVKIRKCLFRDEVRRFNNMYSYSACIVSCRMSTVRAVCKCSPYYLPSLRSDGPVCTLNDLKCLNKYREKLFYLYPISEEHSDGTGLELELQDSLYCPDCLPDCELTQRRTKSFQISLRTKQHYLDKINRDLFFDKINMTNKCYVSIFQSNNHGVLNRLDVVSYWYELLSNIGGFGGFFLGYSIFSIFELIYFVIYRLFKTFKQNYAKYH